MASQFADEDMSEDDDTTQGTGEEASEGTSQESGAKEE